MQVKLKEQLLEAGLTELKTIGIDHFSMRKIAKDCGVSSAAPYKYYENKQDFLFGISEYLDDQLMKRLAKIEVVEDDKEMHTRYGIEYLLFLLEYPFLSSSQFWGNTESGIRRWVSFKKVIEPSDHYFEENNISKEERDYYYFKFQTIVYGTQNIVQNQLLRTTLDIRKAFRRAYQEVYQIIEGKKNL